MINRCDFDPKNPSHIKALRNFIKTGKWDLYFNIPQGVTNLPYHLLVTAFMEKTNGC